MHRLILALAAVMLTAGLPSRAETVTLAGRTCQIALPATPAHAPILVLLHGGGGNGAQVLASTGLGPVAAAAGYAVLAPDGSGLTRLKTWNAGYCCGAAQRQGVDDAAFLDAVVAEAARRYGLDGTHVFAAGMSNGAMMAETWAAQRPGRLSGVAAVSGTLDLAANPPRAPVPLIAIHGTADAHVPLKGGMGPKALTRTVYAAEAAVDDAFAAAWGPGLTRTDTSYPSDGLPVTLNEWQMAGKPVQRLFTVIGGGHSWPGAAGRKANPPPTGLNANAEILSFFNLFRQQP